MRLGEPEPAAHAPQGVLRQGPAGHGRGQQQPGAAVGEPPLAGHGPVRDLGTGQAAGERPYGERGQGDRGRREAVAGPEVRQRQVQGPGEGGDAEQSVRRDAVRVAMGGEAAHGDRGERARAEPAGHRTGDDGRYDGGEGGAAVAEEGQHETEAGERAGADPVDPGGEQQTRRRRTQQQRAADGARPGGGERQTGLESADGGRQQVAGKVPGREKGDEGPGQGAAGGHGRSQKTARYNGLRKEGGRRRSSTDVPARNKLYQAHGSGKNSERCDLRHLSVCGMRGTGRSQHSCSCIWTVFTRKDRGIVCDRRTPQPARATPAPRRTNPPTPRPQGSPHRPTDLVGASP